MSCIYVGLHTRAHTCMPTHTHSHTPCCACAIRARAVSSPWPLTVVACSGWLCAKHSPTASRLLPLPCVPPLLLLLHRHPRQALRRGGRVSAAHAPLHCNVLYCMFVYMSSVCMLLCYFHLSKRVVRPWPQCAAWRARWPAASCVCSAHSPPRAPTTPPLPPPLSARTRSWLRCLRPISTLGACVRALVASARRHGFRFVVALFALLPDASMHACAGSACFLVGAARELRVFVLEPPAASLQSAGAPLCAVGDAVGLCGLFVPLPCGCFLVASPPRAP